MRVGVTSLRLIANTDLAQPHGTQIEKLPYFLLESGLEILLGGVADERRPQGFEHLPKARDADVGPRTRDAFSLHDSERLAHAHLRER